MASGHEVDSGAEIRLFKRCRKQGMSKNEALHKRLIALEVKAAMLGLSARDKEIIAMHVEASAAVVWPDQSTDDYVRRSV